MDDPTREEVERVVAGIGARCTLCGRWEPLWMDAPPTGCFDGGNDFCQQALNTARAEAMRRKVAPDCFDENGRIKPGARVLGRVATAMMDAGINMHTGLPERRAVAEALRGEEHCASPPPPGEGDGCGDA